MLKLSSIFSAVPDDEKVELNISTICKGHHEVTYRGVKAIRCPFDYVVYQMILFEVKPDLVIEIGTNTGGGALYIADLMNNIGHGIIHTIDIIKQSDPVLETHPRIKLFTEGWQNYNLEEAKTFSKILVIEDSTHMYEDTLEVLRKFSPLVSSNSYLIVEDGIVNELGLEKEYRGGPLKAIREFLKDTPDFVVDRKWCDLFGKNATFNVNGYLRRK
jgi:cephalosporin hydroxylase